MIIQYVINTLPYFYAGITPPQVPLEKETSILVVYLVDLLVSLDWLLSAR